MTTVKVRVAVAVNDFGEYYAVGAHWMTERQAALNVRENTKSPTHVFWLEADLPWCHNVVKAEVKKA